MTRPLKTLLALAAALLVVLGLAVSPASAKEAKPKPACWKVLINDWYDGTIDGKYGLRCYREALERLKGDAYALGYTDAYDQINRAYHQRRAELAALRSGSGPPAPPSKPPGGKQPDGTRPGPGGPPTGTLPGRPDDGGPAQDIIKKLGPEDATSVPIPLIVLAGIAVLLMAAGAASLIARRKRVRRVTVPVRPAPPAGGS